jgi:SAM-dependent methyltransferase
MRSRFISVVLIVLLCSAFLVAAASAADVDVGAQGEVAPAMQQVAKPLYVATMGLNPPDMFCNVAAAYTEKTGVPVAVSRMASFGELTQGLESGLFDAVLGTCSGSAKLIELKLVDPDSKRVGYYHRLAILVPPKNPRQIVDAKSLERVDLRIGLLAVHTKGPWVDQIRPRAVVVTRDQKLLLDLLEQGRIDAAVTLDTFGEVRPNLVTIRVPRRIAGDGASMEAPCFVSSKTTRKSDVAAFLEFVAKADEAHKVLLSSCVMTEDGSRIAKHSPGTNRFMQVYRDLAKQIAEDYATGRKNCLDLGCGTGEMTVEVAKATGLEVTGLDIEPEAIELAAQYASDCGMAPRMHWVVADVHALPFADSSFDLVISRGSIPFWRDHVTALREVMRVLKPGGVAFIGGGHGRYTSKEEWEKVRPGPGFHPPFPLGNVPALMARAGIADYRRLTEGGSWIEFRKPAAPTKAG